MRPPCELVQREYLPLIRSSLAKKLTELGHSQNQIAESLGITQAAVSKYLNQDECTYRLLPYIGSLTTNLADSIHSGEVSSDALVKEVCETCMSLRIGSEICIMHREAVPFLGEINCQICSDLLGGSDQSLVSRAEVLEDLQKSLRIIQHSKGFPLLVPQVRANLVASSPNATQLSEIAGIPGRITIIEGKARALVGPRFGASTHTATILLEMKLSWPHVRACLCLSGEPVVVRAARLQKVKIISLEESESDPTKIAESVKLRLPKYRSNTIIGIHVPGGLSVEPILYIFGSSATILAELSEKMGQSLMK